MSVCVHVCVCVRALYEIFTSIFLNLLCNFTVNNCIILFQVAKKPVMTRTRISLYSQIYLSCTVGLTSEASTQSQLCII